MARNGVVDEDTDGEILPDATPEHRSLWHGTTAATRHAPLPGDDDTDVVVVGAGITGLTTAVLLAEAGARVMVLEARQVAAGTTGGTTGKLTSQHGMIYADLTARHGEEVARAYGQANEQAIAQTRSLCQRLGIESQMDSADAFLCAENKDQVASLRRELAAARRVGLPTEWAATTELPFPVAGAVRFTGQARLHPVDHCNGLARALTDSLGGTVHGSTRVTAVHERDGGVAVQTEHGTVTAGHAVLATLVPITDRGFEFARVRPVRTYGVGARVRGEPPGGMYASVGQPSWSVNHHHGDDGPYLIVVGHAHESGHDDGVQQHEALMAFAIEHFDVEEIAFRWSAHDAVPDDRLPFIGTTAFSRHIHVATGFQKWGLTNAMVAGRLLTDIITGLDNPLQPLFAPTRTNVTASARQFVEHNLDVARRFFTDRAVPSVASVDDIPPGGGATVRVDGQLLAVSRDEDGTTTSRSATCTHLGCIVQWNIADRSWDCPCHGSRFAANGQVLDGPTTRPLADP